MCRLDSLVIGVPNQNWAASVLPLRATVEDWPCETISLTASNQPVPASRWWRVPARAEGPGQPGGSQFKTGPSLELGSFCRALEGRGRGLALRDDFCDGIEVRRGRLPLVPSTCTRTGGRGMWAGSGDAVQCAGGWARWQQGCRQRRQRCGGGQHDGSAECVQGGPNGVQDGAAALQGGPKGAAQRKDGWRRSVQLDRRPPTPPQRPRNPNRSEASSRAAEQQQKHKAASSNSGNPQPPARSQV